MLREEDTHEDQDTGRNSRRWGCKEMRVPNEGIRDMVIRIEATEAARTQMNTAMAKILEQDS